MVIVTGLAVIGCVCAFLYFAISPRALPALKIEATAEPDLDSIIAVEDHIPNIRESAKKLILYSDPDDPKKTPYSLVYIHGFSASREEIRPVPDLIAKGLGANLFYTRLSGHGADGDAMAQATYTDWIKDIGEAITVGKALGDKVIFVSTSTGGALVTKALSDPQIEKNTAASIFVSPNFKVNDPFSWLLDGKLAKHYIPLILGPTRGFAAENDRHAAAWTTNYSTTALIPMADAVAAARHSDVSRINTPALFVFSPEDQVVDPQATREVAKDWGGAHDTILVTDSPNEGQHVIAGDILSPSTTKPVSEKILTWLKTVLPN